MILRPYQETILEQLRAEVHAGRDPVVVSPCGSGKGSLIAVIVNSAVKVHNRRVIFAVHGKSLVVDMSERISKLGIAHGVLMGGYPRQRWHRVQVASIDTLHRMAHPPEADLIIADEADGAMSPTWRKTLVKYPNARLIGATATPCRTDGKGLGKATGGLFDSMVLGPPEQELIDMGYLVGSRVLAPPPPPDLKNLKKTAGEFNAKQQSAICDKAKIIGDIVEHYKRHAMAMKAAAFGVDKAHAFHIAQSMNVAGVPFAYVDDDTPTGDPKNPQPGTRAAIWRDLDRQDGTLMGVSSCGITLVGWDHPIVSCLIDAAKTASFRKHKQKHGRGSRIYPGKDHFLVLDHVGNVHYHAPYGLFEQTPEWCLDGTAIREAGDKAPSVAQCKHSYKWPDGRVQFPCYATFRAGPRDCPYCGIPLRVVARKIEVEAGELTEIVRVPTLAKPPRGDPRAMYEELMAKAHEKNYKPAWVGLNFKAKHGFWPPKKWETDWLSRELQGELNKEMARV